ncbi:MAG: STAS domain-containing protein [Sedimentisphaerales bacterium]|nr:STAS domain-containing protein [Sedimentisphaerales bacterium]
MADAGGNIQNIIKDITREGDVVIVKLTGEIDMHSSTELRGCLLEITQERPRLLVINMEEVLFLDSSGLAVFVETMQQSRTQGRQLKLVGLHPRVRSIFEISRLMDIFQIYDTQEEALA